MRAKWNQVRTFTQLFAQEGFMSIEGPPRSTFQEELFDTVEFIKLPAQRLDPTESSA